MEIALTFLDHIFNYDYSYKPPSQLLTDANICERTDLVCADRYAGICRGTQARRFTRVGTVPGRMAAPTIYRSPIPGPLTIKYGEKLEIAVTIAGNPAPTVSWFMNGRPVLPSDDVTLTVQHRKYSLRIDRVKDDVKSVIVEATNDLGSDRRVFNITVYKVLSGLPQDDVDNVGTERTEGINVYYHRPRLHLAPVASISSLSLSSESDADDQGETDDKAGAVSSAVTSVQTVTFTVGDKSPCSPFSHSSSFDDSGFTESAEFLAACDQDSTAELSPVRQESVDLFDDSGYLENGAYDRDIPHLNSHVTVTEQDIRKSSGNTESVEKPERCCDVTKTKLYSKRDSQENYRYMPADDNIKFQLTTEYYSPPSSGKANPEEGSRDFSSRKFQVETVRRRVVAVTDGGNYGSPGCDYNHLPGDMRKPESLERARKYVDTKTSLENKSSDSKQETMATSVKTNEVSARQRRPGRVCLVAVGIVVPLLLAMIAVAVWLYAFNGLDLVKDFVSKKT